MLGSKFHRTVRSLPSWLMAGFFLQTDAVATQTGKPCCLLYKKLVFLNSLPELSWDPK